MRTHITRLVSKNLISLFVLVALVASTVVPAVGQTKRRPRLRRRTRIVARQTTPPPAPQIVYYNVNTGQVIRVRMNQTIASENARIGDQFTTTTVIPIYASGIEVIPAGSEIIGRVVTVTRAARQSKAGSIGVHFDSLRLPTGIARAINGDLTDVAATVRASRHS